MTRLPTQPGQELNGFLALLLDKDSIAPNSLPFLEPEERTTLQRLIHDFNRQGATDGWQRETLTFLASARSKVSTGLLMLTDEEVRQLDGLLSGALPPRPVPTVRTTTVARRPPKSWSKQLFAAVAAALVAVVIIGGVVHSITNQPPVKPIVAQPVAPAQQQPLSQNNLQQTSNLLGGWRSIAPTDANPDTAQPAVLLLKQNGGTLASEKWQIPFAEASWQQQDSPYIAKLSVEGEIVHLETTTQETFTVHTGQAFVFEQAPEQVYLVDTTQHVWYTSLAQATSLRQPLTSP